MIEDPGLPNEATLVKKRGLAEHRSLESRLREIQKLLDLDYNLKQISKMTDLKYGTVRVYASKLRKGRINKTVKVTKCPECGSTDIQRLHDRSIEIVCADCGLVLGKELEYGEGYERFVHQEGPAPTSSLAFGKSLGDTLPTRDLYSVLAKSSSEDLPIRARHIKTMIKYSDHPKVMKLLEKGSRICKTYSFENDHVFAEAYGKKLRILGAFLAISRKRLRSYKRFASATFYFVLKNFDREKAEELRPSLSFRDKDLVFVSGLLRSIEEVKKK